MFWRDYWWRDMNRYLYMYEKIHRMSENYIGRFVLTKRYSRQIYTQIDRQIDRQIEKHKMIYRQIFYLEHILPHLDGDNGVVGTRAHLLLVVVVNAVVNIAKVNVVDFFKNDIMRLTLILLLLLLKQQLMKLLLLLLLVLLLLYWKVFKTNQTLQF